MRKPFIALCAWIIILSSCTYTPPPSCEADYLIFKINEANSTPVTTDTIDLPAGCTYTLTKVDNRTTGNNGLPTIDSPIIINGHGSTIQRSPNAPERFRIFEVHSFGQSDLTLYDLTLTGGNAYDPVLPNFIHSNSGGAIYNGSHLTVQRTIIKENSGREGGGIYNQHMMTLKDVIIDSNEDYFGLPSGAGIHNRGTGIIINSTISHNGFDSFHPGKGIYNQTGASLELTNSTVSRNAGSGIDNQGGGNVTLNHVTISFNGFAAVGSHGDLYTSNSIFTGQCSNTIHPVFPNLDMDGSCGGQAVSPAALMLDPLADNGGFTQTNALRPGSAAIDIVERLCQPTDQRGVTRPKGPQCDAGAFEYDGPPAVPLTANTETPTPTATTARKDCTFTAAINVFCRSGPGASLYPDVDDFTAGQSAPVVGQSVDGAFVYVEGPNTDGVICAVPSVAKFGALNGDCARLAVFTPPAPLEPTEEEAEEEPPASLPGCTVRNRAGAISCVVPCPSGAIQGNPAHHSIFHLRPYCPLRLRHLPKIRH